MDSGQIWSVREKRSKRTWKRMVNYFIDTAIRLSNGERYIKHCGVPSGSSLTNVIDSIVNAIVMRYLIYELVTDSFPLSDMYLGDDSVVILPQAIDLEKFSSFAASQFGMVFNVEKSSQVVDRSLIQFVSYHNSCGTPWKPLDTIVASTIYPEHTVHHKSDTIRMTGEQLRLEILAHEADGNDNCTR